MNHGLTPYILLAKNICDIFGPRKVSEIIYEHVIRKISWGEGLVSLCAAWLHNCVTLAVTALHSLQQPWHNILSCHDTMTKWNLPNLGRCRPGTIQLVATQSEGLGLVQICLNGSWIDVYGDTWSNENAAVACRQLGYSFYGKLQVKMYVYI